MRITESAIKQRQSLKSGCVPFACRREQGSHRGHALAETAIADGADLIGESSAEFPTWRQARRLQWQPSHVSKKSPATRLPWTMRYRRERAEQKRKAQPSNYLEFNKVLETTPFLLNRVDRARTVFTLIHATIGPEMDQNQFA
jgi:hypothetical protein